MYLTYIGLDLRREEADDREHSNDKKSANLKKTAPTTLYRQMLTISCSFETGMGNRNVETLSSYKLCVKSTDQYYWQ